MHACVCVTVCVLGGGGGFEQSGLVLGEGVLWPSWSSWTCTVAHPPHTHTRAHTHTHTPRPTSTRKLPPRTQLAAREKAVKASEAAAEKQRAAVEAEQGKLDAAKAERALLSEAQVGALGSFGAGLVLIDSLGFRVRHANC